ncbi:spermidine synthase [bacterium BMS3Abin10]|nr:spermidine synthase [bacterium BMS3Abin10]GBE39686.1 spermidine synthase [bacterium BMS3Bbin08]HDH50699.1 polyamine aminopropyltransferase [Nitrospirota bacterium]HDK16645.1 polyamine aminopropyltransferase [Nitrospirota bacterium]
MAKKFSEAAPFVPIEYRYEVQKVLYKGKSKFQKIMVFENPYFGRMLILDDVVQLTERDEFFYHEMLTHVLMHAHPDPRKVVVIGGGDGGSVREVLKHKCVEKVYFVEIDKKVIDISKKFFPSVICDLKDPRLEIRNMDGAEFVRNRPSDIDIVIVDSTDPVGFATTLFTKKFFASVKKSLRPNGMFVTHSESLSLHVDIVAEVQKTLKKVFPVVDLFTAPIATYPGNWWTFSVASMKLDPRKMRRKFGIRTKYYSPEIHQHAFVPKGLYKKLMSKKLKW